MHKVSSLMMSCGALWMSRQLPVFLLGSKHGAGFPGAHTRSLNANHSCPNHISEHGLGEHSLGVHYSRYFPKPASVLLGGGLVDRRLVGAKPGFKPVMTDSRTGILSMTPEVLNVRQGTGAWMAKGDNSHCHVLAPHPYSMQAPCWWAYSCALQLLLLVSCPGTWEASPCYGSAAAPSMWERFCPRCETPTVTKFSHPLKGSLHIVKRKFFSFVLRWLLSLEYFRLLREPHLPSELLWDTLVLSTPLK